MNQKARQAVDAWNGDRPSLGERVDATRAAQDAAAEVMTTASAPDDTTPPEPESSPPGRPMPPDGATGSWVWIRHPDGAGITCARAVGWTRVTPDDLSPDGWAMRVTGPRWVAMSAWTGPGGVHATSVYEGEVVPSTQVEPIPGHYFDTPSGADDQRPA